MRRALVVALAALLATGAAAQEERTLAGLSACRLDPQNVVVRVKYNSSPCWEAQDPQITNEDGVPIVTINTSETAEVCTMNLVIGQFAGTIPLADDVYKLRVVVNDPNAALIGSRTAAIAEQEGCTPPEEAE